MTILNPWGTLALIIALLFLFLTLLLWFGTTPKRLARAEERRKRIFKEYQTAYKAQDWQELSRLNLLVQGDAVLYQWVASWEQRYNLKQRV